MTLEPEIIKFIEQTNSFFSTAGTDQSIAEQRTEYDSYAASFTSGLANDLEILDKNIQGPQGPIPIRQYQLRDRKHRSCILYLHGGGFVFGGLNSHDFITKRLAVDTGCLVVGVDYRMAPEHVFPAAFEDCLVALEHIQNNAEEYRVDAAKIIVCGDSAGGNLSAAVALANRDKQNVPLLGQILIYPALGGDMACGSYVEEADAPLLTSDDVRYYNSTYIPAGMNAGAYGMPLLASDFSNLPPALLLPVEHDPLRDDCYDYQKAMVQAGGEVDLYLGEGLVHSCLRAINLSPGVDKMYEKIRETIRRWINK